MSGPIPVHTSYPPPQQQKLDRALNLPQSVALNVANMVGIGPFITIPAFLLAMGGPQAMVAWVIAAILVLCDGLVWSELGAAIPGSGGTYHFLRETFGRYRWGRVMPFLFIWQFLISGTLELASGYIGMINYVLYAVPQLEGPMQGWGGRGTLAAGAALLMLVLLCRRIRVAGWLAVVLCTGTIITVLIVIIAGLMNFNSSLITMPTNAFHINGAWLLMLGGSMRIAIYDYLGYYNICHLGDEVKRPEKTIPRAVIISIIVVASIYMTMNLSIIGVVPWQEAMRSQWIAADFMERLYGPGVATAFTWFIVWTAAASLFAGTLGYSRIPYAAAREGDFFPAFGAVHPRKHYPWVSLVALSIFVAIFCFFTLDWVINAAVTVRILVQFVGQIIALHILRTRRPDVPLPFRMKLYPLPSLIALVGWIYMWITSDWTILAIGMGVIISGIIMFFIWRAAVPAVRAPAS